MGTNELELATKMLNALRAVDEQTIRDSRLFAQSALDVKAMLNRSKALPGDIGTTEEELRELQIKVALLRARDYHRQFLKTGNPKFDYEANQALKVTGMTRNSLNEELERERKDSSKNRPN